MDRADVTTKRLRGGRAAESSGGCGQRTAAGERYGLGAAGAIANPQSVCEHPSATLAACIAAIGCEPEALLQRLEEWRVERNGTLGWQR